MEDLSGAALRQAIGLVYAQTGVTVPASKQAMLQGRLRPLMRRLGIVRFADYLDRVGADAVERGCFIDAVTTHQTQFFRTPKVWRFLSETYLPDWQARHAGRTLQAWSAAASTGQECFSLAMVLEEWRQDPDALAAGTDYRILASDISTSVLRVAEAAHYDGPSAQQLREGWPARFARFNADVDPSRFRPASVLRQRIRFQTLNLMHQPAQVDGGFDLVLLRNVLIYFTPEDGAAIVARIAEAMRPGGLLVIGESESLNGWTLPFEFLLPQIYRRA